MPLGTEVGLGHSHIVLDGNMCNVYSYAYWWRAHLPYLGLEPIGG